MRKLHPIAAALIAAVFASAAQGIGVPAGPQAGPGSQSAPQSISRPAPAFGLGAQARRDHEPAAGSAQNRFDLADAAAGAGVAIGATLLIIGGARFVRSPHRPGRTSSTPG